MEAKGSAVFPTSFAQERLWLMERLMPGTSAYHVPVALRMRGPVSREALQAALTLVVERHESLRTVFDQIDGVTVQRVLAAPPPALSTMDVPGGPAEIAKLLSAEAIRPFDLQAGPLLRAVLFRLAADDHVLVITLHHLVCDMWSLEVLLRELSGAYNAYLADARPDLPELPVQYADFAVWQREQLTDAWREELLAYWRDALAGAPARLELPTDRPRPPIQNGTGAQEEVALTPELSREVREFARRHNVTPFMVLLSVLGVLFGRLAGAEDVVVATAGGTRDRETEPLIGCFINTLPLRLRLAGDPAFADFLAQAREVTLGALANGGLPFDKLVEDLAPRRDLSQNPLAQVLFVLQNARPPAAEMSGLQVEPVSVDRGGTQCDLSVQLQEAGGQYTGFIEYSVDLFDAETIREWWRLAESLLRAAMATPGLPLSQVPWMAPDDLRRLMSDLNATAVETDQASLYEPFARQAAASPDATALAWPGGELSYAELDRRAAAVAAALHGQGVGRGGLVAVYGDRDADLVIAILGTVRAGGAYIPLNTDYPHDRLAVMLADARPSAVLTQRHRAAEVPPGYPVLLVDELAPAPAAAPPAMARPGDLAYVIYTSGSTGTPKGVTVEHRSAVNLLGWMQRHYPLGREDVLLLKTPVSFDVSVTELFWWASAGARLAVLPAGDEKDPRQVLAAIARHQVTVVNFVPSMLGAWLDLLESDPKLVAEAGSLRLVACAGEALTAAHVERFHRVFRAAARQPRLANLYGPTETTVYSSYFDLPAAPGAKSASVPIGRPVGNTSLHIMDALDRPQPVGVPGELCIAGAGVSIGYLNRPGLTADRFVPHPYAGQHPGVPPGARMYRTGDLCRYTRSGAIEWLGRIDFQVKIRGFRVELGEVESALRAHAEISDALAMIQAGGTGTPARLIGYYVSSRDSELPWPELRSFLRRTLPDHMIPEAFVSLPEFPLSPNGKIDRKALPAPSSARPALGARYVAPRSPLEHLIAEAWQEVLQLDAIGVNDDFFDLGGQSLRATQVASALTECLRVEIPLRAIFEAPTIAAQAELATEAGRTAGVDVAEVASLFLQVRRLTAAEARQLLVEDAG
jgi:amino acid adenylation domain-containing protein